MVRQDTIQEEEKDIYLFGIQQGFVLVFNIITFLLIGWCLGMIWQALAFLVFFTPIRIYAGGYHARTQGRCYLYSCIMVGIVLALMKISSGYSLVYAILGIVSCVLVWFLSPVEDRNKPLDNVEENVYRHRAHKVLCLEMILCIISSFLSEKIFFCICSAIISSGIMVLTGFVTNKRSVAKNRSQRKEVTI